MAAAPTLGMSVLLAGRGRVKDSPTPSLGFQIGEPSGFAISCLYDCGVRDACENKKRHFTRYPQQRKLVKLIYVNKFGLATAAAR